MENNRKSLSLSRSVLPNINSQRLHFHQIGDGNVGRTARNSRPRRCSSLTTQEASNSTARPSCVEKRPVTRSNSRGEIVVSFQSSAQRPLDARSEDIVLPALSNLAIDRPHSFSTGAARNGELGLALEVNYRSSKNAEHLPAGSSTSPKEEHERRVSLNEDGRITRRRFHSGTDGLTKAIDGKNMEDNIKPKATNDDVFFPSSPISRSFQNGLLPIPDGKVLKSPNGMAMIPKRDPNGKMVARRKITNSPTGVMQVVLDAMTSTKSTPNGKLKIPYGITPNTPVGLVMLPKGMVKSPNGAVKIPNSMVKALPDLMKKPGALVKVPKQPMIPHNKGNHDGRVDTGNDIGRRGEEDDVKCPDWTRKNLPAKHLNTQSFQIPCRPNTPRPQQLSQKTFHRRRVRLPPLQLQHATVLPNSIIETGEVQDPDGQEMRSPTGNNMMHEWDVQKKRLRQRLPYEQFSPTCSPVSKKFFLCVSLEEAEEAN